MADPVFDPTDPTWLAHRYDRASDRILYRHVPRAMHGEGPFLTDELVGGSAPAHRVAQRCGRGGACTGSAGPFSVPLGLLRIDRTCPRD
ncbi:hypothetical protein LRS12_08980 [Sphingomonas sp. J344]|uniref:hypothetical protein n=1 Tax=Sphingomonas sp. J344 TaxID=2898434 RepID=UPI0021514C9C|nr:hypothetical protein [Sphingomonas sp. J344]MCR5870829.1 hypothetical protein [Sphingomonas sp. J344]